MYPNIMFSAIKKFLFTKKPLTETELIELKTIILSQIFMTDMSLESDKIYEATLDDYEEVFMTAILNTFKFSWRNRYGLIVTDEEA